MGIKGPMPRIRAREMNKAMKEVTKNAAEHVDDVVKKVSDNVDVSQVSENVNSNIKSFRQEMKIQKRKRTAMEQAASKAYDEGNIDVADQIFNNIQETRQLKKFDGYVIPGQKVDTKSRKVIKDKKTYADHKETKNILEEYSSTNPSLYGEESASGSKVKNNIKEKAKEQADEKVDDSRKFFTNDNIKKTVGLGVGGAIVFNMFDKGGQMSNAELYGQQQPYGY